MTKRSLEAQRRIDLKRAAARQEREGAANLVAAAAANGVRALFVDFDFALGLLAETSAWSPARRKKVTEAGRAVRLSFLPETAAGDGGVDLVVRIPADRPDLATLSERLVGLGLASNRRRSSSTGFVEFAGRGDEAAVRVLVEAAGGCVTAIASPPVTTKQNIGAHDTAPAPEEPPAKSEETPVPDTTSEAKIETPASDVSPPNAASGAGDTDETSTRKLLPIPDLTRLLSTTSTPHWPDRRGEGGSGALPGRRLPPLVRPAENAAVGFGSDLRRTPSGLSAPSTNVTMPSTNGEPSS